MDGFISWTDNPGLVFSYVDASNMPEGLLAKRYTLADNFFQSAFGGSFLNHLFLICACAPTFPNAPPAAVATLDQNGRLALTPEGKISHDGYVTPDGYAINTAFTVNAPHPANVPAANLLPNQTAPTIGDRLDAAKVSFDGIRAAGTTLSGNPDPLFSSTIRRSRSTPTTPTERRPRPNSPGRTEFLRISRAGCQRSFIERWDPTTNIRGTPPNARGQEHVLALVDAVRNGPWNTAIIITYDENGGRWDPSPRRRSTAGVRSRVTIIIHRTRSGVVPRRETVSISRSSKRWDLRPLGTRGHGNLRPVTGVCGVMAGDALAVASTERSPQRWHRCQALAPFGAGVLRCHLGAARGGDRRDRGGRPRRLCRAWRQPERAPAGSRGRCRDVRRALEQPAGDLLTRPATFRSSTASRWRLHRGKRGYDLTLPLPTARSTTTYPTPRRVTALAGGGLQTERVFVIRSSRASLDRHAPAFDARANLTALACCSARRCSCAFLVRRLRVTDIGGEPRRCSAYARPRSAMQRLGCASVDTVADYTYACQ